MLKDFICNFCSKTFSSQDPKAKFCSHSCSSSSKVGERNGRFIHGLATKHRLWIESVKELNPWECFICKTKEDIHIHHIYAIKPFPSLRFNPLNGIILCRTCHYRHENTPEVFGISLSSLDPSLKEQENPIRKDNKFGCRGIGRNKKGDYFVRIGIGGGERIQLKGIFKTLEEAIAARKAAEIEYW